MQATLDTLVADVRAELGSAGEIVGGAPGPQPRFELFHAPNSICSQKVRAVLAHHGIRYTSDSMNIFTGQTYLPSHVRLRMVGCDRLGGKLMSTHSGSTSASFGGCDAAVVPTLIDWDHDEIIVDSKRICLYLDDTVADSERLRPVHLREAIDRELEVVDNLPNYQMLVGRPPGEDHRPLGRRTGDGATMSLGKVQRCDRYLAEFAGDAVLVQAYSAKRAKEQAAADGLFSDEAMQAAYAAAAAACKRLDDKLAHRTAAWLLGPALTMADLFWVVELLRMKNLGAGTIWEQGRLPAVAEFLATGEQLQSIRSAVLDWPGALY